MEEKTIKPKREFKYKKQLSLSLILVCSVLFVLTTFNFAYPIKAFMLGTFGIMLYPMLFFTIVFSAAILSGRKFVYSFKYVLYLFLCFFFLMCVLHVIFTTSLGGKELSYGEYLLACYHSVYTPGGLFLGLFTYPVTHLLHNIAGIVVYAIAFIISLYFVLSYLESIKQEKQPVQVENYQRYQNFNTITNDLQPLEDEDEDAEQEEEEDESLIPTIEEESEEEDIFIKDEEDIKVKEAKKTLGLLHEVTPEEENEPVTTGNKLFEPREEWKNRAVEKEDKPQKIVYDGQDKQVKKENPVYEENKKYLKTLFEYNLDSKNPIINAGDYEDYKEKMRLFEQSNTKPFSRDLDVNQTLQQTIRPQQPQVNTPEIKPERPQNSFENNFGIEPNRKIEGLNSFNGGFTRGDNNPYKPSQNLNTNNFGSNFNQNNGLGNNFSPNTFNTFNPANTFNSVNTFNASNIDDIDEDELTSSIEGLEDSFNSFSSNKVSPLNPTNFDLTQPKIDEQLAKQENLSAQRFMAEETNVATPFDTTKLSDGDVATSINRTYNLPKGLMGSNISSAASAANAKTPGEIAKENQPNFGFTGRYVRPSIDLLENYVNEADTATNHERNIEVLEKVLEQFGIPAKVEAVRRGAAFTRYELHMPMGISVRKIQAHASDIALALAANGDIRIEAPIKGKSAVGIEVPNAQVDKVGLREIIDSPEFNRATSPLTFALGKDVDGSVYCCNLAKMPHLLVAGSTGSGKSVCLNSLLVSLLYRTSPEDLRLILVDPKRVEFGIYNNLPHLLLPKAITEPKKALNAFDWLINEMERRFLVFQDCFVKNIGEYNDQEEVKNKTLQKMPYIVLIVDELADLVVTTNKKELEEKIIRLTQKARAAGIHLILATQRPSVDIITGTIKINLPARIAFAVSQFVDSKTILDQGGAEKLLGRGDMLYSPADGEPLRVQGAFVDTPEVKRIVDFVKDNNQAVYDDKISRLINEGSAGNGGGVGNTATVGASNGEEFDSLMPDALKLVIENGQASISMLQRRFSIGFSRAARIIDQMELAKFISSSDGSKPRNVFITMDDYNQIYGNR